MTTIFPFAFRRRLLAAGCVAMALAASGWGASPADEFDAMPPDLRTFREGLRPLWNKVEKGEAVDWEPILAQAKMLAEKYPADPELGEDLARGVLYCYELVHRPDEVARTWQRFVASPNAAVAALAHDKVRVGAMFAQPVELKFTALDGRVVDLAQLHGRVVLLDFWATWCGPCMAEMPNVKRVYAAWHDRGFEIVGISCDISPAEVVKTPIWTKAAKTGDQVLAFTRKNGMPWPQYYEGRKHNEGGNTVAARFAVAGIPAAFLIDRSGRVVAANVRGEKLEEAVRRLLASPAKDGT